MYENAFEGVGVHFGSLLVSSNLHKFMELFGGFDVIEFNENVCSCKGNFLWWIYNLIK